MTNILLAVSGNTQRLKVPKLPILSAVDTQQTLLLSLRMNNGADWMTWSKDDMAMNLSLSETKQWLWVDLMKSE